MFRVKRSGAIAISNCVSMFHRTPQSGIRILSYHSIGSVVTGDVNGLYSLSPSEFHMHVNAIQEFSSKFSVPIVPFGSKEANGIVFSFDDGYIDALSIVAPTLSEKNIPFHVFVSPENALGGDKRYLAPLDLVELQKIPGATIGAHGNSHVSLTSLDEATMEAELHESKISLEQILQVPVTTMSYPFGDVSEVVRNTAEKVGFTQAACSKWGFVQQNTDRLMQPRVDIWKHDSKRVYLQKVSGQWNWFSKIT